MFLGCVGFGEGKEENARETPGPVRLQGKGGTKARWSRGKRNCGGPKEQLNRTPTSGRLPGGCHEVSDDWRDTHLNDA